MRWALPTAEDPSTGELLSTFVAHCASWEGKDGRGEGRGGKRMTGCCGWWEEENEAKSGGLKVWWVGEGERAKHEADGSVDEKVQLVMAGREEGIGSG
jgi:hypothetical protein